MPGRMAPGVRLGGKPPAPGLAHRHGHGLGAGAAKNGSEASTSVTGGATAAGGGGVVVMVRLVASGGAHQQRTEVHRKECESRARTSTSSIVPVRQPGYPGLRG
jgi:hypothetical protein